MQRLATFFRAAGPHFILLSCWFVALLGALPAAHAQPAFQVTVTPPGPVILQPGGSVNLLANAFYPAFSPGTAGFTGSGVNAIAVQPSDGKIVVGGNFTAYNGTPCNNIARLKLDGTIDNQFFSSGFDGAVQSIAIQTDGKILVGGAFTHYGGSLCNRIARLTNNGILDNTFAPTGTGLNGAVNAIAIQPVSGKIVVGGAFSSYNNVFTSSVARLNTNGTLDNASFALAGTGLDGTVYAIAIQPSTGKIIVGGSFAHYDTATRQGLARLDDTGGLDAGFNLLSFASNTVNSLALLTTGNVLVGGNLAGVSGGPASPALIGVTASGGLDPTFRPNIPGGVVNAIVVEQGTNLGNVLVGGTFLVSGAPIIRLNSTTGTQGAFSAPLNGSINAIAVQSNERVLTGGTFTQYNTSTRGRIARLTTSGTLDDTATPVPGATYTWNSFGAFGNVLTVTSAGYYAVTVTVSGQTPVTSDGVMVSIAPDILINSASTPKPTPIFGGFNNPLNKLTIGPNAVGLLMSDITVLDKVVVQTGGTLILGPYRILASSPGPGLPGPPTISSFELQAGATLSTGYPSGIDQTGTNGGTTGAITLTQRLFSSDASYIYTSTTTNQVTGTGLPSPVRNLTDSTSAGVSLSLTSPTSVSRVLKMASAGNLDLNLNNQRLTLLSNAAGTALVVNRGSGRVQGQATVERYINTAATPTNSTPNTGPGYRYYSAPVAGMIVSSLSANTTFTPVVTPAAAANVFYYDEFRPGPGTSFDNGLTPPAISTPLDVGKGYAVNLAATQKLLFQGTLTTGAQTSPTLVRSAPVSSLADNRGWNLVGNPYPSPIDWSLLAPADTANIGAAIYVYESTGPNAGFYVPYVSGVGRSPILATGQSFFVRVRKGKSTGRLTFDNRLRITSYDTLATFSRLPAPPQVAIALAIANRNGGSSTSRPPVVVHQNANALAGPGYSPLTDAYLIPTNTGTAAQALSVSVTAPDPNEELAIKGVPSFSTGTSIPLTLRAPGAGTYKLALTLRVPSGVTVFLDDTMRVRRGSVRLNPQDSVTFDLTAQEATQSTGRFSLRFVNTPLPVKLTAFAVARRSPTAALLTWTTASEKANDHFEVEASTDGTAFQRLGQVPGQGTSGQSHAYSFADVDLARYAAPVVYYRLRQVDTNGTASYSPVHSLDLADLGSSPAKLAAYPQPASGLLHMLGTTPGGLLALDDLLGRRVYTAPVPTSGTADLLLPAALPAGTYLLRSGSRALRIILQ